MHKLTLSLQPYVSVTANSYGQYGNIPQCVLMLMKMCQTQWCALFLQDVEGRHSTPNRTTGKWKESLYLSSKWTAACMHVCVFHFFTSSHTWLVHCCGTNLQLIACMRRVASTLLNCKLHTFEEWSHNVFRNGDKYISYYVSLWFMSICISLDYVCLKLFLHAF